MPYCLGLYIEENYIKYAKVLKEKEQQPKIENHGIVFYDNLNMAIDQIIKETYSYGIDIATNLNNEFYNYFSVFAGRTNSALRNYLRLSFAEEVCAEKNINPASIESRYLVSKKKFDEDNNEAVYISANKSDISARKQLFKNKLKKLLPVSLANLSLLDINDKTNIGILNIDSYTTLTIVVQGQVKKVFNINVGMSNILSKLNQKYSSYSKSYERCKATTVYTEGTKDLVNDDNEDAEIVTPLLYDVGQRIDTMLKEYQGIVNKIYITGSCVAINNIDLYFEELLDGIHVEILKPNFVTQNIELIDKIKDYTEVNGAIALAISEENINKFNVNFLNSNIITQQLDSLKNNKIISNVITKIESAKKKVQKEPQKAKQPKVIKTKKEIKLSDSNKKLVFSVMLKETILLTILLIGYIFITTVITNQYDKNIEEIAMEKSNVTTAITNISNDKKVIDTNIKKYEELQQRINELSEQLNEINGITYDVPNFMTRLALVLPDDVVITQIDISSDKKVTIKAQCDTYAPLGFFITSLKVEEVMKNISTKLDYGQVTGLTEESETTESIQSVGQKIIINGEIL